MLSVWLLLFVGFLSRDGQPMALGEVQDIGKANPQYLVSCRIGDQVYAVNDSGVAEKVRGEIGQLLLIGILLFVLGQFTENLLSRTQLTFS